MKYRLGIIGIACALSVIAIDISIVNTANPVIQKDLGASISQLQWILNAYAIGFAALLVTAGRFGDIFGRRKVIGVGLTLFGLASLACGLAPSTGFLIGARAIQGLGASIILPISMALFIHEYPAEKKGRAIGLASLVLGVGMGLGPVLGGIITEFISWRWIFFINLPIVASSLVLLFTCLDDSCDETHKHPIDWLGLFFLIAMLLCLVMGIIEGPNFGWGSPTTIGLLIGAGIALGLLVWAESRVIDPILPFRLFANRLFLACSLANLGVVFLWWTTLFLVPLFLFNIRDLAPLYIGLTMLFFAIPVAVASLTVARITEKIGPKLPLIFAFLLLVIGSIIQAYMGQTISLVWLAIALILIGFGCGTSWSPLAAYAIASLPKRMAGTAAGGLSTIQEMGGTIGLAICVTLFRAVANLPFQPWHYRKSRAKAANRLCSLRA